MYIYTEWTQNVHAWPVDRSGVSMGDGWGSGEGKGVRTGSWMGPPQGKRAPRAGHKSIVIIARDVPVRTVGFAGLVASDQGRTVTA